MEPTPGKEGFFVAQDIGSWTHKYKCKCCGALLYLDFNDAKTRAMPFGKNMDLIMWEDSVSSRVNEISSCDELIMKKALK